MCEKFHGFADEVAILARDLSARSEHIEPVYPQYGDLTLCVGRGGFMEWTAAVRGGPHYIHFLYASGEHRPCRLSVNGRPFSAPVLDDTTLYAQFFVSDPGGIFGFSSSQGLAFDLFSR